MELLGGLVPTGLVIVHLEGDRVAYEERVPTATGLARSRLRPFSAQALMTSCSQTSACVYALIGGTIGLTSVLLAALALP